MRYNRKMEEKRSAYRPKGRKNDRKEVEEAKRKTAFGLRTLYLVLAECNLAQWNFFFTPGNC